MLTITVPESELFDDRIGEFIVLESQQLKLEHSLVSISKWESKWKKPYLSKTPKTQEEQIDYIRCMTLTQNVKKEVFLCLTKENIDSITKYIDDPRTATWFSDDEKKKHVQREVITSEVIYYWMIALQIPFECQKWHLNRLLTLINVCNIKNQPGKKMSKNETMSRHKAINAARRKAHNARG